MGVSTWNYKRFILHCLNKAEGGVGTGVVKGRRIYDGAVREVVILIWEASDRICGKRLNTKLPFCVRQSPAKSATIREKLVHEWYTLTIEDGYATQNTSPLRRPA